MYQKWSMEIMYKNNGVRQYVVYQPCLRFAAAVCTVLFVLRIIMMIFLYTLFVLQRVGFVSRKHKFLPQKY
jgi:hypothetical protein